MRLVLHEGLQLCNSDPMPHHATNPKDRASGRWFDFAIRVQHPNACVWMLETLWCCRDMLGCSWYLHPSTDLLLLPPINLYHLPSLPIPILWVAATADGRNPKHRWNHWEIYTTGSVMENKLELGGSAGSAGGATS